MTDCINALFNNCKAIDVRRAKVRKGKVKILKVDINGKVYDVKKSQFTYKSATRTFTFKGKQLAGEVSYGVLMF